MDSHETSGRDREVATLGGGCFWCTEAIFDQLKGVDKVESGYSGGKIPDHGQLHLNDRFHSGFDLLFRNLRFRILWLHTIFLMTVPI